GPDVEYREDQPLIEVREPALDETEAQTPDLDTVAGLGVGRLDQRGVGVERLLFPAELLVVPLRLAGLCIEARCEMRPITNEQRGRVEMRPRPHARVEHPQAAGQLTCQLLK